MPTYPYIILSDSEADLIKRFRAVKMSMPLRRTDSFKLTLGGKWDKSAGTIVEYISYVLKIPAETDDQNYGVLTDLLELFRLNSPSGTPNDLLTLVDHYGDTYYVKFQDDIAPEPLTTQLEGPNAWHYVSTNFVIIQIDEGSGS